MSIIRDPNQCASGQEPLSLLWLWAEQCFKDDTVVPIIRDSNQCASGLEPFEFTLWVEQCCKEKMTLWFDELILAVGLEPYILRLSHNLPIRRLKDKRPPLWLIHGVSSFVVFAVWFMCLFGVREVGGYMCVCVGRWISWGCVYSGVIRLCKSHPSRGGLKHEYSHMRWGKMRNQENREVLTISKEVKENVQFARKGMHIYINKSILQLLILQQAIQFELVAFTL